MRHRNDVPARNTTVPSTDRGTDGAISRSPLLSLHLHTYLRIEVLIYEYIKCADNGCQWPAAFQRGITPRKDLPMGARDTRVSVGIGDDAHRPDRNAF
jgi:hypothetical protein